MQSKKAKLKIIQDWMNDKNESKHTFEELLNFQNEKFEHDFISNYRYIEKNSSIEELSDQFLSILKAYNNSNFYGPDWKINIFIQDKEVSVHVTSVNNELSINIISGDSSNRSDFSASLSMLFEDLRLLTNLDDDLMSVITRNAKTDNPRNPLIRPVSDFLFGACNMHHLNSDFKNTLVENLYVNGKVSNLSGSERFLFPWAISSDIGSLLYRLIMENNFERTLEIGLAFGLSALFICQAHKNKKHGYHTAIDPCQSVEFESIGVDQVKKAGLSKHFRLLEEKDYDVLPMLLRDEEKFDFIFIDGLHMHDYVVIDYFYSDILLEVDGLLVFDDCQAPGVSSAVAYFDKNRNYEYLKQYSNHRFRAYKKLSDDTRTINDPNRHIEYFQKTYEIMELQDKLKFEENRHTQGQQLKSAAIIGIHGVLPLNKSVESFWESVINEDILYDSYSTEFLCSRDKKSKGGEKIIAGMVESAFEFDPQFFNMSNSEAELMDPQLRQLLMSVYKSIEDSGYTVKEMADNRVGVFIGTEGSDYNELHKYQALEDNYILNYSGSVLANRISYYFDFNGPCEVINTMCSSGAMSICRALELIRKGEIDFAVVGAVKLNFSEMGFQSLKNLNIATIEDKCYSFHNDSNGYIKSEGVVTMILTSSENALQKRDHIYANIKQTAINYNGKDGHSMFSPSKKGQKDVMRECYESAGISISDITCVEAQGMGNEISDFVEYNAINETFNEILKKNSHIINSDVGPVISTVKPILGHMECVSALGSILKIILSFQTRTIYKIPYLKESTINEKLKPINKGYGLLTENKVVPDDANMLIALNSFGASGTNVHLLLEQGTSYKNKVKAVGEDLSSNILTVSAKSNKSLGLYLEEIHSYLSKNKGKVRLKNICHTFQTRREHYNNRIFFYIEGGKEKDQIDSLKSMVSCYLNEPGLSENIFNNVKNSHYNYQVKKLNSSYNSFQNEDLFKDGLLWLSEKEVDWLKYFGASDAQKVGGIPTYPFDLGVFKLDPITRLTKSTDYLSASKFCLHPLLHCNTSDLHHQSYQTTLTGVEFFLSDHQVNGKKVLPAVAYLEMARAAIDKALPINCEDGEAICFSLNDIVWVHPIVVTENKDISITLFKDEKDVQTNERIYFEIYSREKSHIDGQSKEIIHCQGQALLNFESSISDVDIESLRNEMRGDKISADKLYHLFSTMGVNYGPAHKALTTIYPGDNQLLAELHLPEKVTNSFSEYALHPSLLDSAVQSSIGMLKHWDQLPKQPLLPFSVKSVNMLLPCEESMLVWVRYSDDYNESAMKERDFVKLDVDLFNCKGKVCVQLQGLSLKLSKNELADYYTSKAERELKISSNKKSSNINEAIRTAGTLRDESVSYFRKLLAKILKVTSGQVEADKLFSEYGLDSIIVVQLTNQLRNVVPEVTSTLFFEVRNINGLVDYFLEHHEKALSAIVSSEHSNLSSIEVPSIDQPEKVLGRTIRRSYSANHNRKSNSEFDYHIFDVAVIGLSGRYPKSNNLAEFWENLSGGVNCITEIPKDRWNWEDYYDSEKGKPGKIYSKWGGFLESIDKFDPLFFKISPKEAERMDPQERLFLESCYHAIEDAGYIPENLADEGKVGVFVGVMNSRYTAQPAHYSIANRISYLFDFQGPSMAIDTACSSSLTAVHLALESLYSGLSTCAVAGGVSLIIDPVHYLELSEMTMLSSSGQCKSFGEHADGFVDAEGVGVTVLKSLKQAEKDGDHIYGVIKGSAINAGGKTNGYTVPNPNAQSNLISEALKRSKVDAKHVSYIEAHGTGTALGDPIEISGLNRAFKQSTYESQFCSIGSLKSNIGHCESAAGIAGLTKVLLQLKHQKLVPSLHSDVLNPEINFSQTPFQLQRTLQNWERPTEKSDRSNHVIPRIAGISSFGAGGANAHIIVQEYQLERDIGLSSLSTDKKIKVAVPLSARTEHQLKKKVSELLAFIETLQEQAILDGVGPDKVIDLNSLAYTLQVGREGLQERLGFMVNSIDELIEKLQAYLNGATNIEDGYRGKVKQNKEELGLINQDEDMKEAINKWVAGKKLTKLLNLWVKGLDLDWRRLYSSENRPIRMSLPVYPFSRDRYWLKTKTNATFMSSESSSGYESITREKIVEEKAKIFYYPVWKESTLKKESKKHLPFDSILIFSTNDKLFSKIKSHFESVSENCSIIKVKLGASYQGLKQDRFIVNPEKDEDFDSVLNELKLLGRSPQKIIYECSSLEQKSLGNSKNIHKDLALYVLLSLSQALMRQKSENKIEILSVFSSSKLLSSSKNSALSGFLKTLSLENPNYSTKSIEVQSDKSESVDVISKNFNLVLSELQYGQEKEVRYQFDAKKQFYTRYTKELCLGDFDKAIMIEPPLKQNGVYIVTGGLGGVGFIISQYLVKAFQAKLAVLGRSKLTPENEAKLKQLKLHSKDVLYFQADVTKLSDVNSVVKELKSRFLGINGIIHSAGANNDSFILKKTKKEVGGVVSPKVSGVLNLDQATKDEKLDLFISFSSLAGVLGNMGQSDYAYANHFLDSFSECRENLRKKQKRWGKTLSISWPFWESGGMKVSQNVIDLTKIKTGFYPLPSHEGIIFFEYFLRTDLTQGVALYGLPSKVENYIEQNFSVSNEVNTQKVECISLNALHAMTEKYLKDLISDEIKLASDKIDSEEHLEAFGIDSVMINRLNAKMENDIGTLPKTLFYEYETIEELTKYLVQQSQPALTLLFNLDQAEKTPSSFKNTRLKSDSHPQNQESISKENANDQSIDKIAIIGMHGRYPEAENLEQYWENLKHGKDSISLVPANRWDYEAYYDPNPEMALEGKIYCKWGGFLDDVDKFDPEFFNIPAEESKAIDPQERIFLESVWAAIEDAGYTRESLKKYYPKTKGADVGVFVGVTTNSYHLLAYEEWRRGNIGAPGTLPWSIANRVSYFFDFQGPSMPIDTACSSSLVAVHLACESLKKYECRIAVAGGVNLYLHSSKYHSLCQRGMLSRSGRCSSFTAGDDGFVPGEGLGTIVLKPLSDAEKHHDHIYAVISASAFEHSGKSNGYSAPNPNSQANLISNTLAKAKVHPEEISYIEGHGTGTQLGDSLEVVALTQAFQKKTDKKQFCPIGSVKANTGHSESAAGIAGVTKILLQMKHKQLVPSIYMNELNPNIDFVQSPFYLQSEAMPWDLPAKGPRRALINSFGAGGVNACMVLEEYKRIEPEIDKNIEGPYLVVLSAKNEERLKEYVGHLSSYLKKEEQLSLANLAYTLQIGRESFEERLAIVASDVNDLAKKLNGWALNKVNESIYRGSVDPNKHMRKHLNKQESDHLKALFNNKSYREIAEGWVSGKKIDWALQYRDFCLSRIPLPTYPFAKQRYWITDSAEAVQGGLGLGSADKQLHPLLSYNSSTLKSVSFCSTLTDRAFYALDHKVNGEMIFPGAGFIEIACIAGNIAGEKRVSKITDIVWAAPLSFEAGPKTVKISLKTIGNVTEYEITSLDEQNEMNTHSEGRLLFEKHCNSKINFENSTSIQSLKDQSSDFQSGNDYYKLFEKFGFDYGPGFQTIKEFYHNEFSALAKLKISDSLKLDFEQYILHPSIVDGALQAVAGLMDKTDPGVSYLPFALDELEIFHPALQSCYAYVELSRASDKARAGIKKFDIKILNDIGTTLIYLKGFYVRSFDASQKKPNNDVISIESVSTLT